MKELLFILGHNWYLFFIFSLLLLIVIKNKKLLIAILLMMAFLPMSYYFSLGRMIEMKNNKSFSSEFSDPFLYLEISDDSLEGKMLRLEGHLMLHSDQLITSCKKEKRRNLCYLRLLSKKIEFYKTI